MEYNWQVIHMVYSYTFTLLFHIYVNDIADNMLTLQMIIAFNMLHSMYKIRNLI